MRRDLNEIETLATSGLVSRGEARDSHRVGLVRRLTRGRALHKPRLDAARTTLVVLANAASLIGTFLVTSVLGLAFWLLAARYYSKEIIGLAGGLISAMTLVGAVATLGLGTMLMGELPRRRLARRPLVASAMTAAALSGITIGFAFALAAPLVSSEYRPLAGDAFLAATFVLGIGLTSAVGVFDNAAIGALRGGLQLWRNGFFAGAKLVALGLFALLSLRTDSWLLAAWIAGLAVSLASLLARDRGYARSPAEYRPRRSLLTNLWWDAVGHQAYNIAYILPMTMLPILVLGLASATANATFYLALQVASALYVIPTALTTVLFAAGAADALAVPARLRLTMRVSALFVGVGVVVISAAGGWALSLFGAGYASDGPVLLMLGVAAIPLTVKGHFIAITRIERRLRNRLAFVWAGALIEIAGGAAGAAYAGALGAAVGWLAGLCVEAVVMAPTVRKALMREGDA